MMTLQQWLSHYRRTMLQPPEGGVPRDGDDAGRAGAAGLSREEGCIKRARDEGPEWAAAEGVFFEDAAEEDSGLVDSGGQGDRLVVVRLVLRADDGGDQGPTKGRM